MGKKPVVLFIDECTPRPYDTETLYTGAQGGTESTVTRIAEGLAKTNLFQVIVEQHNRAEHKESECVIYSPLNAWGSADYVICLRAPSTLSKARERFPEARVYLWAHDLYTSEHANQVYNALTSTKSDSLICVSDFHKRQVIESMQNVEFNGNIRVKVVYNPLDATLTNDHTPYDKNQLAWFSSPHKGLEGALMLFNMLHAQEPEMRLVIHNPGYFENWGSELPPGVEVRDKGNFYSAINTVKKSLCVFYPNLVFPETFGLVFAEADQVGTPVLTHPIGAAREVLDHPQETMDCRDYKAVIERVLSWRAGSRPTVRGKPQFKLSKIVHQWITQILN